MHLFNAADIGRNRPVAKDLRLPPRLQGIECWLVEKVQFVHSLDLGLSLQVPCPMRSADIEARRAVPPWQLIAHGTSIGALGVLGFAYSVVLLSSLGVGGKERDLALFVVGTLLLAPVCAAAQVFLVRPDFRSPKSGLVELVNCWAAIVLLATLVSISLVMQVTEKAGEFWIQNATWAVVAVAVLHIAGLAVAVPQTRWHRLPIPEVLGSRACQVTILTLTFFVAGLALFWVDRSLSLFGGLFTVPPFSKEPGAFKLGYALIFALFGLAAVVALVKFEAALVRRGVTRLQRVRTAALCIAVTATFIIFFDFSLASDLAHYLTNLGPALHLLHGGTLMVDTFSQYGPGPVLITLLGLRIGPTTFGTAQMTVQLFNLTYYGAWLVCLHRMTDRKLAALLLGILSIAFFFASYIRGYGNINDAPSVVAFHYLPTLSMVLALSYLRPPQRHSLSTALATFVSSIWSVDALIGTLGVHFAFLGLLGLRDRAVTRLVADSFRAIVPAIAAIIIMMLGVRLQADVWPDYGTYLQYFSSYNPRAAYWSVVANPLFFGWLAMLLAVFVVLADAWTRVFHRTAHLTGMDDTVLSYRFVPMAALLMIQSAYFVGRSYPSALSLAVLPFCAIAIPAALGVTTAVVVARGPSRLLALIPVAIGLWVLTFTSLSLFRQNSPYSLLLHECRDLGRCSPAAIMRGLNETLHVRPILEKVRRPIGEGWIDANGIVRDAVAMMIKLAPNEPTVTVLLGRLHPELDFTATEVALMYAGKWNRWPRSFTTTDELVTPLAQRIIAAPVRLREGELVLVRRDETALGFVETGILKRIRAEAILCRLPEPSREVIAYRVAGHSGCPPG
jgi:hypothetical protein